MIIHTYSFFEDLISARRNYVAIQTWYEVYKMGGWLSLPVLGESLHRSFNEKNKQLPFVTDLINEALNMPGDYICLTNSDTCFSRGLHGYCQEVVDKGGMMHGHRRDHGYFDSPLPEPQIITGARYPGLDLFLFPKQWWINIGSKEMPDMVIGREAWDAVLATLMHIHGSVTTDGLIYHEKHGSQWEQPKNRYSLPGQLNNLSLATDWLTKRGFNPRSYGIMTVPADWKRPLPTTQETPPGGWRVCYKGLHDSHYCFEVLFKRFKLSLKNAGIDVPNNLIEIIIKQSHNLS